MGGKMSREKGKRGERTVASLFKEYGYDAKRSAQFCGKTGQAADVVGVPLIHIEVKFQEAVNVITTGILGGTSPLCYIDA